MLRTTNLLTSGLLVLVTLAGQNVVHAGHHGGGGSRSIGSSVKLSSNKSNFVRSGNVQHLSSNSFNKNIGNHARINLSSRVGTNFNKSFGVKSFNGYCSPKSSCFWNYGKFGCYNNCCYNYGYSPYLYGCSYPSWGYGYNYGCCGFGYGYGCNYGCSNYVYTPRCYSAVPIGCIQPYYVTAYQTCCAPVVTVTPVVTTSTSYVTTTSCPTLTTVAQAVTPVVTQRVTTGVIPGSPVAAVR